MKVAEAGEKVNSEKIIILFVYYNLIFLKKNSYKYFDGCNIKTFVSKTNILMGDTGKNK